MNRARVACAASCAAGFFTLPLYPLSITLGWFGVGERAPGDTTGLGLEWLSSSVMWASAVGLALAVFGFALGWWHRREVEVRGVEPDRDMALARAGELLGAGVAIVALFLLLGTVMHHGTRVAAAAAANAATATESGGATQPK